MRPYDLGHNSCRGSIETDGTTKDAFAVGEDDRHRAGNYHFFEGGNQRSHCGDRRGTGTGGKDHRSLRREKNLQRRLCSWRHAIIPAMRVKSHVDGDGGRLDRAWRPASNPYRERTFNLCSVFREQAQADSAKLPNEAGASMAGGTPAVE